ncbi:MAG: tRNA modification GTPase, partial [Bacillota bacterium]
ARMLGRLWGGLAHEFAGLRAGQELGAGATAGRRMLRFAGLAVPVWVYGFHGPRSYTGEDLVELHVPGNPLLVRMLLDELLRRGARAAEAGEFTARAYFNGRMDLTEAEGVAAAVGARGEQELRAARQLLSGELARRLRPMMDQLANTLALVEVGIDFSEEDVTFISGEEIGRRAREIDAALERLLAESARFERLTHEPQIVLVGRPKAGKSTLLNAMAGTQRAVVSPVAGTTRDVIWAEVALERGMIRLMDAAGLEEHLPAADDASPRASIARQMHARALAAMESADGVVLLHDATDTRPMLALGRQADVVVLTKTDLRDGSEASLRSELGVRGTLAVSARTGENLDELRRRLDELAFGRISEAAALALNSRHLQAIEEARGALSRADQIAREAGAEVVALELREALDALGRIVGQITPDDVLGRVFATFCIGK